MQSDEYTSWAEYRGDVYRDALLEIGRLVKGTDLSDKVREIAMRAVDKVAYPCTKT